MSTGVDFAERRIHGYHTRVEQDLGATALTRFDPGPRFAPPGYRSELDHDDYFNDQWAWYWCSLGFTVSLYRHGWYLNGPCCHEDLAPGPCEHCGQVILFFTHEDLAGFAYDHEACEAVLQSHFNTDVLSSVLLAQDLLQALLRARSELADSD